MWPVARGVGLPDLHVIVVTCVCVCCLPYIIYAGKIFQENMSAGKMS